MFNILDAKKIEDVEMKIVRDFSAKTKTAYILPFKFSKPKKVKKSVYRVEMETINVNGTYYPAEVFATIEMIGGELVYILNYDYESLGKYYYLFDGNMLCGIKSNDKMANVEMLPFDIDIKNQTYEQVSSEKQSQPGNA